MDIIFDGQHDSHEASEHLVSVIQLFQERYKISHFREMRLYMTLVDDEGEDVELIDTETSQVYRTFEVLRSGEELRAGKRPHQRLRLIVDNT